MILTTVFCTSHILTQLHFTVVNEWVLHLAARDTQRIVWVDKAGLVSADDIAALSNSTQTTSVFWSQSANTPKGWNLSSLTRRSDDMLKSLHQLIIDMLINQNKMDSVKNFTYLSSFTKNHVYLEARTKPVIWLQNMTPQSQ